MAKKPKKAEKAKKVEKKAVLSAKDFIESSCMCDN